MALMLADMIVIFSFISEHSPFLLSYAKNGQGDFCDIRQDPLNFNACNPENILSDCAKCKG